MQQILKYVDNNMLHLGILWNYVFLFRAYCEVWIAEEIHTSSQ